LNNIDVTMGSAAVAARGHARRAGGRRRAAGLRPVSPSPARRDPVEDLRRIAFLLERTLESSYRVKAFRTAAAALAALPADDVALLASTGGLRGIKGIGDRTAAVVEQAVAGEEPEYLASLEAAAGAPLTAGDGSALRTALRGDLHLHSDWSDGGSPIDEMARTAAELGHAYAALTDHSPRLTVARGLTPDRLRRQLEVVRDVGASLAPFRLLSGIEVDVLSDGGLDQEDELLEELDVVVASVHSELRMPADAMTRRMLAAIANPHTDVLGHCTGRYVVDREFLSGRSGQTRSGKARPESQFDAERVFAACAEAGVAVEINSRPERLDPPLRLLRLAVDAGCLFAIDTDAHAPGQLDWQPLGCARAVECGVPAERVVNTWPLADLLAWTRDHDHRPSS
jgi:putative hydrolase